MSDDLYIQELQQELDVVSEMVKDFEALEKVEEVVNVRIEDELINGLCPTCGGRISKILSPRRCELCGKRIEWESDSLVNIHF